MNIFSYNNNRPTIKDIKSYRIQQNKIKALRELLNMQTADVFDLMRYLICCLNYYFDRENNKMEYVDYMGKFYFMIYNYVPDMSILDSFFHTTVDSYMVEKFDKTDCEIIYGFENLTMYNKEFHKYQNNCFINFSIKNDIFIDVIYSINKINEEEIDCYISRLIELIDIVIQTPNICLYDVQFKIGEHYNYTENCMDKKTIIDEFAKTVNSYNNKEALKDDCSSYTFKELDVLTDQFALYLKEHYSFKNKRVALYMNRCANYVISMLAVLKLGCAYVPVNPAFPSERVKYILDSCKPDFVICGKDIIVDDENVSKYEYSLSDFVGYEKRKINLARCDDIAYIIYTSGTTGLPKGVMITQNNVTNMKYHFKDDLKVVSNDIIGQYASISFDASVSEIYMALFTGALLYIIEDHYINNLNKFKECLNSNNVTIITLPPVYSQYLNFEEFYSLRMLLTAGSECGIELYKSMSRHCEVVNAYGPTECTVCATTWHGTKDSFIYHNVPIGKSIPNVRIYIINEWGRLLPTFMVGEICIGGNSVGQGYIGDLEKTNEKYVQDIMFPNKKMYKTGDYGRLLPDGSIEFLGRKDDQFKVNGIRIDLSEINAAILSIDGIENSYTMISKNKTSVIYSYYETKNDKMAPEEIRKQLQKKLPSYSIPTYIIYTEHIELNASGKVDISKLEKNPNEKNNRVEKYEFEYIFENELEYKNINLLDDFFLIGGNSMTIIKIVTELTEKYNISLETTLFFEKSILGEMFTVIQNKIEESRGR